MYRITIEESTDVEATDGPQFTKVFEQTLPEIDLPKLIAAINAKPRKLREKREVK